MHVTDELRAEALRPFDEADVALKRGSQVDQRRDLAFGKAVRVEVEHIDARKPRLAVGWPDAAKSFVITFRAVAAQGMA